MCPDGTLQKEKKKKHEEFPKPNISQFQLGNRCSLSPQIASTFEKYQVSLRMVPLNLCCPAYKTVSSWCPSPVASLLVLCFAESASPHHSFPS